MSAISRRSPKLAEAHTKDDVRRAVDTLEDRPRVPEKTPASSAADGYEGEVCADGSYLYLYRNGAWKRASLSSF